MIAIVTHCLVVVHYQLLSTFLSCMGLMPSAEILCPNYSTDDFMKAHLACLSLIPASPSLLNISSKVLRCTCSDSPVTKISSKYTHTLGIPCKIPPIIR